MQEPTPLLAVTMGDPAGIGLDILLAAFRHGRAPCIVLYGCSAALAQRAKQLGLDVPLARIERPEDLTRNRLAVGVLPIVDTPTTAPVAPGKPTPANAQAVITAIERAVADVMAGAAAAVVTCPIAKATLTAAGFKHPGHTEFLAELAARHVPGRSWTPVMMLASDELRVVPVTIHVPLARVPALLREELIVETVRITAADLQSRFAIATPRIAVAGLNPHAGESGTMGDEEVRVIAPAIARLRQYGLDVRGPLPADTMFHAAARRGYDVAVTMYHDQGLIPIKTIAFDTGVNVTLGLPFVRTSPDHGTAFDIAGTGKANPASLIAALDMARRMASRDEPS